MANAVALGVGEDEIADWRRRTGGRTDHRQRESAEVR